MLALWLADAPAEMLGIFKEVNPHIYIYIFGSLSNNVCLKGVP